MQSRTKMSGEKATLQTQHSIYYNGERKISPQQDGRANGADQTTRTTRSACIICFTETWLDERIPDSLISLDGFQLVRADRDPEESGRKKGGGLAVFINSRWCSPGHITVKEQFCTRNIELVAVSIRPFYIPREFSHVIIITVYIPPSADAAVARELLHTTLSRLQTSHPQSLLLISGDFNHAPLTSTLPTFTQYVKCCTREQKTLDLLYANTKEAYSSAPLPPLGRSDHNLVHLIPTYIPMVRKIKPTTRIIQRWTEETSMVLRDCFETTDWEVLCKPHGEDIDSLTHCITDYINFCVENIVPSKKVRCYSNNKPWVTRDLRALLNKKKRAFRSGEKESLKTVQKELKREIRRGKTSYRRRLEKQLQRGNTKEFWRSLRTISGHGGNSGRGPESGDGEWANELNQFFNRFSPAPAPLTPQTRSNSTPSFSSSSPSSYPSSTGLCITVDQVTKQLKKIEARKATGPDGLSSRLLRECADQLGTVILHIFNLSLSLQKVPTLWKTSCVVPVPKTANPREPNHFRPVALTSHLIKTLERIILNHLSPLMNAELDPLQFAYRPGIGVEDATTYLMHRSLSHLENSGSTVRMMFFDLSSAFNTIQPVLLREKLEVAGIRNHLAAWIIDFLTNRPQYVRLQDCTSDVVTCSTGAPQGTVLSPLLFSLYTSDFKHNTDTCHLQKFSDDTAIVERVTDGNDLEYRGVITAFVDWCRQNHLHINTSKTKEMVVDFRRTPQQTTQVNIQGKDIEIVEYLKYLGVHLNSKLDWSTNIDALYRRGQSRLYLLRSLRSFGVCRSLLRTFYDTVVASTVFYAVVCWGSGSTERDRNRLNKLIRRASSVLGCPLDSVEEVGERRMLTRMRSIMDSTSHPLHESVESLRSSFSSRLRYPHCRKERFRRSFLPSAVRLFNLKKAVGSDTV
ncbi:uncharacterized protein LOC144200462 [Stigmatopora nigra]